MQSRWRDVWLPLVHQPRFKLKLLRGSDVLKNEEELTLPKPCCPAVAVQLWTSWPKKVGQGWVTFCYIQLVGGLEHFLLSIIYGMSSFPLTFIFFKMVKTTNQSWWEHLGLVTAFFLREIGVLTCEISNQPAAGWLPISKSGPISFGLSNRLCYKAFTSPIPDRSQIHRTRLFFWGCM